MAEARDNVLTQTVVYRGDTCSLFMTNNEIRLTPNRGHDETRRKVCGYSPRRKGVRLPRADLIGAELVSHADFRIYYRAMRGRGVTRRRVVLRQTENIDCQVGSVAEPIIERIRHMAGNVERQNNERQRILVIINPKSGKGKAGKIYEKKVRPFVRRVLGWRCDSEMTTMRGHGREIIQRANLGEYLMIALLGGDGTIHEALQGLLNRCDWRDCIHVPIIPFPTGSGNALATSLEITDIDSALIAMSKQYVQKLDILSIGQNGDKIFSFLGIMYGALSSIDIESENLRWMGDYRFTFGGIRELFRMQSFKVKLAYLPEAESSTTSPPGEGDVASGSGGPSTEPVPSSSSAAKPTQESMEKADMPTTLETRIIDPEVINWFSTSKEDVHGLGPWILEHECDIRLLAALNLPYISQNSFFMPHAGLSDGALHLMKVTTQNTNRREMLKLLTKSAKGNHLSLACVDTKKIKALLFEPIEGESWLTVDGEVINSQMISVEVFPKLINVLSLQSPDS